MDPFELIMLLMSGVVGGTVAWRYATFNLYRRPGAEWATDQIHPDRISRRLLKRRKRHRLQMTIMLALLTPMIMYVGIVAFAILVEIAHTR